MNYLESSSKSSYILSILSVDGLFWFCGRLELIFASLHLIMSVSTPRRLASPRLLIARPESVPGPQIVSAELVVCVANESSLLVSIRSKSILLKSHVNGQPI